VRVAVLTVSDRSFGGEREDRSGPAVAQALERLVAGVEIVERKIVPDDRAAIESELKRLADTDAADLVLTTGGTGLSPRDVTPQATLAIADYEVPGIGEAMRAVTRASLPAAILSRQFAGVRGRTLVVNLPGSPSGAVECLEAVAGVLRHAVATLRGEAGDEHPGPTDRS
jgi:molybdenum cofactor synthesis domain-containing protein